MLHRFPVQVLRFLPAFPVAVHDLGEQRAGDRQRVGNGIGPCPDGAQDALLGRAAGGNDGVGVDVLMMATSVEKARDLIRRPKMRMPLHSLIQAGSISEWLRRVPV